MEFPQRFGKYTLLKRIATGGMADIFLAHMRSSQGFEKEVVVKRLRPEHAANPDLVGMFLDEARTAANLTHANIAQIFDLGGSAEEGYFIAMEFVRGVDLRRVCEQGIAENNYLPLHHAVRVMADVCDALAYAHGEVSAGGTPLQVVHRDVSPTNILVSYDGAVKLIDFGIAKARTQATLTKVGQIKGKFGYMAPEQCLGMSVDARTDIFAVGINLYEITLGRRLFRGETEVETLEKIEAAEVEPPRAVNPRYPEVLERIVMRALARDPEERYQDARQMQMALEEFLVAAGLRSTAGMLAAYMRRVFREQIAVESEELNELRGVARSMPPIAVAPSLSLPPGVASPSLSAPPGALRTALSLPPNPARPSGEPAAARASVPPVETAAEPAPAPSNQPVAARPPAESLPPAGRVRTGPVAPLPGPATPAPARVPAEPAQPMRTTEPSRPAGPSVVIDPMLTAPGLRAEVITPAPAPTAAQLMNPWSSFSTSPTRSPARPRLPADFTPPPPSEVPMDDDISLKPPRNYFRGILLLLVIAGGGFGIYKVMIDDARSGRERGNPNLTTAAPRFQDLVQVDAGPPKPPPAKALLRIESDPPGGQIILNGNMLPGVTPTAVQTFANHTVTVQVIAQGHKPATQQVEVSGTESTVRLQLEAGEPEVGTIEVASTPEQAEIHLNGQPIGATPLKLEKLPAGFVHTITLRRSGFYDHTILADVEPGKETRVHVRLSPVVGERTMGTVRVETLPIGAAVVSVDEGAEKAMGRTSAQDGVTLNAPIGLPVHLRATLDKYTPALADLDVKDAFYTVYLRLAPPVVEYGALSVTGTKGLTIYLGPEEVGNVPLKDAKAKVGEHPLVILDEKTNVRVEATVVIEKDKTAVRKATLSGTSIKLE